MEVGFNDGEVYAVLGQGALVPEQSAGFAEGQEGNVTALSDVVSVPDDGLAISDDKIAAMIMMGFQGVKPEDETVQKIIGELHQGMLGGVVFYSYNVESPAQLTSLTEAFKRAKNDAFIAVDQEGGRVQRLILAKGFKQYPSAGEVGTYAVEDAFRVYDELAEELYRNGINLNFAPVVDINNAAAPCKVIGGLGRSFSEDPSKVTNYARACIEAHHAHKILTAIKHFPGHGLAGGDTHQELVDVTETVREEELAPFYNLIHENIVDMVMTAHLINRNLDESYPATLSPIILKSLLRDKGYDGMIISDDLYMGAIVRHYDFNNAVVLALQAGCDMIIISNNPKAQGDQVVLQPVDTQEVINIIKLAIKDGRLTKEAIEKSYERIQTVKSKIGISRA